MDALNKRWQAYGRAIGIDTDSTWSILAGYYQQSHRHYHTLEHVGHCLHLFDESKDAADDPRAVECAIWWHDVIYDTHANDNEMQSAELAGSILKGTGLEDSVSRLILATNHRRAPQSHDENLIVDIDLGILGADARTYDKYAAAIRNEYHWVESVMYVKRRVAVLESFLDRASIYQLGKFRERFEAKARKNIRREIVRIQNSIKKS